MSEQPNTEGADDAPTNAPIEHPGLHLRQVIRRIEALDAKFDNLTRPPAFRLADFVQLAVIAIGFLVAIYTAIGIKDRMDDMRVRQSDMERRIDGRVDRMEDHIDRRFDKLDR